MLIDDLPDSIFLFGIVPFLDVRTLCALRCTNKRFKAIVDDESVWRHKVASDFNFPFATTARAHTSSSWRRLYIGLSRSRIYLWGQNKENWRYAPETRLAYPDMVGAKQLAIAQSTLMYSVPFPLRLDLSRPSAIHIMSFSQEENLSTRPVDEQEVSDVGVPIALVAGGFGYAALTSSGRVLGWGRLGHTTRSFSFPTILDYWSGAGPIHYKVSSISSGREVLVGLLTPLDQNRAREVVQWTDWSQPIQVRDAAGTALLPSEKERYLSKVNAPSWSTQSLDDFNTSGKYNDVTRQVLQAEAGWNFVVTLVSVRATSSLGDTIEVDRQLWFWRPHWKPKDVHEVPSDKHGLPTGCMDPCRLPDLDLSDSVDSVPVNADPSETIAHISAGTGFLVALTTAGRLYQLSVAGIGSAHDDAQRRDINLWRESSQGSVQRRWIRMEQYDSMTLVKNAFSSDPKTSAVLDQVGNIDHARITHISAHFHNFAAYGVPVSSKPTKQGLGLRSSALPGEEDSSLSSSHKGFVLLGQGRDDRPVGAPTIVPELQGKGVIKVSFGDWHSGALTDTGKVFTWGSWNAGALGVYDSFPPEDDDDAWDTSALAHQILDEEPPSSSTPGPGPASWFRNPFRGRNVPRMPPSRLTPPATSTSAEGPPISREHLEFLLRRLHPRQVPRDVQEPTRVYFDDDLDRKTAQPLPSSSSQGSFAFDIALGGWHSGALVLDLPEPESNVTQSVPPDGEPVSTSVPSEQDTTQLHTNEEAAYTYRPPHVPNATELSRRGSCLFLFSIIATALALLGLSLPIPWPPGTNLSDDTSTTLALLGSVPYFVPLFIPLALFLVIARWTGEQFFLHA